MDQEAEQPYSVQERRSHDYWAPDAAEPADKTIEAGLALALDAPWHRLRFPPSLEARYRASDRAERLRTQRGCGLVALVVFVACLIADGEMLPDVFPLAVLLRGGASLLGLALLAALRPGAPDWVADAVMSSFALIATAVVAILFLATAAPDRAVYFDGILLIVMAASIVLRPRFPWVVACNLGILAMAAGVWLRRPVPLPVLHVQVTNLVVAVIMTLIITHRLERQHRRAFLMSERDALREAELVRSNAALLDLSGLDGLTGLANRRTVDRHLRAAWTACAAAGQPLAVIMLDVDWFKKFNDTYGHPAGDGCLLAIAAVLRQHVRTQGDLAGRYGGEEFILILQGADRGGAVLAAERVRAAVEALGIPHTGSACGGRVSVSLGTACAMPAWRGSAEALLQAADTALYAAKQAGRARVSASEMAE